MFGNYKDRLREAKEGVSRAVNSTKTESADRFGKDDPEARDSWCSWCGEYNSHSLYEASKIGRSTYLCSNCAKPTIKCRFCENMAKAAGTSVLEDEAAANKAGKFKRVNDFFTENWNNELCSEHDGTTPDFRKARDTIRELGEFKALMAPRRANIYGNVKKYGAVAGGVAAVGTGAWLTAPGIVAALGTTGVLGAASTGTAISSLSGAALTAASLAQVGTGGLAIVTAAGAGLGGKTGFGVANAYLKDIPDYQFSFKRAPAVDSGHRVIFINGFLTENDEDALDWCQGLDGRFNDSALWYLNWEAKTLRKLGGYIGAAARDRAIQQAFATSMALGSKAMAKQLTRGGFLMTAANLGANPWHSAMLNAQKAGAILAEAITRTEGKTFTLLGHSLGARVAYFALRALATKSGEPKVRNAVLMGGAVGNSNRDDWELACSAVSGNIYNCYSDKDYVLNGLYRLANLLQSDPAGYSPTGFGIANLLETDFSDLIDGHNCWKQHLPTVLHRLELDAVPGHELATAFQ